jgi:hypothetical protein
MADGSEGGRSAQAAGTGGDGPGEKLLRTGASAGLADTR